MYRFAESCGFASSGCKPCALSLEGPASFPGVVELAVAWIYLQQVLVCWWTCAALCATINLNTAPVQASLSSVMKMHRRASRRFL